MGIILCLMNIQALGAASPAERALTYVGQDEFTSGAKNATELLKYLKRGDTVLIATAYRGFPLTTRQSAATRALEAAGYKAKFLFVGPDIVAAQGIVNAFVAANPDVNAFMTLDGTAVTAVGNYLKSVGKAGKVPFSSFDLDISTVDLIEKGVVDFTLDQEPFAQGYMSIVNLYFAYRYGLNPVDINTGTLIINKSNIRHLAKLVSEGIGG